jgi:chromosome segregation ATPase
MTDWTTIFGYVVGAGGIGTAIITYLKDRKKDDAQADLTTVEGLQKQFVVLTDTVAFLRSENTRLRADYDASETARRVMRTRVIDLEDEIAQVRQTLRRTQDQCESLAVQLQEIRGEHA